MSGALWQGISGGGEERGYHHGTQRAVSPAATLRRIAPLLPRAGITRLAEVTGLDWLGIPVYQAVRPNSRNLSVSQGKGITRDHAKVSALMEAIELYHAEEIRGNGREGTICEIRPELGYDPFALQLRRPNVLREASSISWIEATNLLTGARTWLPRGLCELNFCVEERLHVPLFLPTSNGLASGNTVREALIHGLCEVAERDSVARAGKTRFAAEAAIIPQTVTSRIARGLIDRFVDAGMRVHLHDATSRVGLPCLEVFLDCPDMPTICYGAGCHPDRTIALLRALTEAAQTRLTHIAGTRDDLERRMYPKAPLAEPHRRLIFPAPERSFSRVPALPRQDAHDSLRDIVRRITAASGYAPLAADLQRPEFGIPVVMVVAPGLQFDPSHGNKGDEHGPH